VPITNQTANTIAEYMDFVSQIIADWSNSSDGEIRPWFRGQRNQKWELVPGEYRHHILNPDDIRADFMLKARELLTRDPSSELEWYFLMQHYGLPTRLLDWTMGSLVGLYFALCHNTGMSDAAVWVLDPWALNKWARQKSDLVFSSDTSANKFLPKLYSSQQPPKRPIAIVPPYNSPRITVQRGTFTIHGSNKEGIDRQYKKHLAKIVIPKESGIQIRRDLRYAGISEFTLFPDLDGLCRDIRATYIEGC
jgi:hypothetical protein